MSRPVVITGRGVISSLGDAAAELHDSLCAGRSGLTEIELFDSSSFTCRTAGEIRGFDPKTYLGKKNFRPLDRTSRLVTAAASLALEDSGWSPEARADQPIGLVLGTMYCSVKTIAEFDRRAMEAGPIYASVLDFANSVINAAAGQAAIWHDLRGINSTVSVGQASGLRAISYAADLIAAGRAEAILAGGAEELCFESFLGFERSGALCSGASGDTSGSAPRPIPFDSDRDGFALGEGAAFLVLESAESAERRGASVLARVAGSGISFDPARGQDESGALAAMERALRAALADAGLGAEEIGAVSTSANGGEFDGLEARALAGVFGEQARQLPVTAVKASLGETLGAGGAMQAVAALETIRTGDLPGIRGLERLETDFPLPLAGPEARRIDRRTMLLNAVGFDGHRCSVVMSPGSD